MQKSGDKAAVHNSAGTKFDIIKQLYASLI